MSAVVAALREQVSGAVLESERRFDGALRATTEQLCRSGLPWALIGGVASAEDALQYIVAGASLVGATGNGAGWASNRVTVWSEDIGVGSHTQRRVMRSACRGLRPSCRWATR